MKIHVPDETAHAQIMERIYSITNTSTQLELSDLLGVRQSSISDAKRRNSLPSDWLLTLLREKSVNPEWITHGEGSKFLKPADENVETQVVYVTKIRPPENCSAQELVNELVRRALERSCSS